MNDTRVAPENPITSHLLLALDGDRDALKWLQTHRVELNAMTPGELIRWLDEHVEQHGALKVIPPAELAADILRQTVAAHHRRYSGSVCGCR